MAGGEGAHCIARVLDLLMPPDEVSEDAGALLLRLERDALALLQAARAVLGHDGPASCRARLVEP